MTTYSTAGLNFPAFTLLRFMHNHHLLQILDRPTWLTLKNGSHSYVNAIIDKLDPNQIHLSTAVQSATTHEKTGKVTLRDEHGVEWEFDHVIFATHADTTVKILKRGVTGMTEDEERVLGGFEFSVNRAVLHSDPEVSALSPLISADDATDALMRS